jgi:anti-sigma B factor antagonist
VSETTEGVWWSPGARGAETPIAVRFTERDGVTVVAFDGALDAGTAPLAHQRATAILAQGRPVVLDLTRVPYVSSAGLRMLLLLHRHARRIAGAPMVLAGASAELLSVLEATGFLRFLPAFRTVGEGVRAALLAAGPATVLSQPVVRG